MIKLLLFLSILVFILIFIKLVTPLFILEGFQESDNAIQLSQNFKQSYNQFLDFYNGFIANWEKSIISSMLANIEQPALKSPSDVSKKTAPQPTKLQINEYIRNLSVQTKLSLPLLNDTLNTDISVKDLESLDKIIPNDSSSYLNALKWMNNNLETSIGQLGNALKGNFTESFEDICQNISKCLNDPSFLEKLNQAQKDSLRIKLEKLENELINRMNKFNKNQELQKLFNTNKALFKKADEIKMQAESGELFNQIDISDREKETTYVMPVGGDALSKLKQSNPEKFKELAGTNKHLFDLKLLFEQINANL